MTRPEQLDKAKKLRELARRGVGGEMENAKAMLEKFKLKYNITEADMDGHKYSAGFSQAGQSNKDFMKDIDIDLLINLFILGFTAYIKSKKNR